MVVFDGGVNGGVLYRGVLDWGAAVGVFVVIGFDDGIFLFDSSGDVKSTVNGDVVKYLCGRYGCSNSCR
ncbi:hypothetical protein NDU88_002137 [Pleurodeles waltl]|uniref:Uncharacterized protein n=1 Tax=Pleurodeles waltl TaxID=8319 RepID=A0AAV7U8F5_PLEWA|nr:hypothetical protein NDU88_002137 [Pleurodeles waltl]